VEVVDELTGEATGEPVSFERTPRGIRLKNIRVPYLPADYTRRPTKPTRLFVARIVPE